MGRLSLTLLGAPEVRHAGRVVTFPTRKALALLAYLAAEGGRHSREKLTALFWPESDARHGRGALRTTLNHLRGVLEEETGESHLIVEHGAVGLNFASDVDLDLHTLQAAFTLVRSSSSASREEPGSLAGLLVQLQAAVDRYRGDFLDGFSLSDAPDFDDWASLQREALHRRMHAIFDRLSLVQSEAGELAGAIETTARWVAHEPLDELAHRRLMQLYFAAGDRAGALQAYQTCRAILARELNAEPGPETEVLVERLRSQTPPPRDEPRPGEAAIPLVTVEGPLVGRATEHARLVAAYQVARRGRTQAVTIEGEAGVGKTRLATEFLHWAAAQGADVLQGRALETSGRIPYQPLVEALRDRLVRETNLREWLSDSWLAELSRLLPELRDHYPALPAPLALGDAEARTHLFDAIAHLAEALARRAPMVLFIDDMHWADAASLDALQYLTRSWTASSSPILLLVSARSEELGTPALINWLASLRRELPLTQLTLNPLTFDDLLRLVSSIATGEPGHEIPDLQHPVYTFSQRLFAETGGQPFFLAEMLKSLFERGVLHLDELGRAAGFEVASREWAVRQTALPSGVQAAIRARLAHLSPAARLALMAGAVLGQGFSFERLCHIAGLDEDEGLMTLDELVARRLVREEQAATKPGGYLFTHDKIREVAYADAGEARRGVYHRRAVEVLQATGASAAELAYHALAAGLAEPAFHFSVAAGDAAMRLFAVQDAIAHYEQAQALLDRNLAAPDQHFYVQLGRAYELTSQWEQAQSVYQAMLAFGRGERQPATERAALNRLATLAARRDPAQAAVFLEQALKIAESIGDKAGIAETEWSLAHMRFQVWEPEAALFHGERALALARELDLQELIAGSLNVIAYANMLLGNWEAIEADAEEARALYAALGNRALEADCLGQLAAARIQCGQAEAGIDTGRAALAISVEIANVWGQVTNIVNMTPGLVDIGAYEEALALTQQGVSLARTLDVPLMIGISLAALGMAHWALLAPNDARAAHGEAMAISQSRMGSQLTPTLAAQLCADCALAKDWAEAHAYARQAWITTGPHLFGITPTRWIEIAALLYGGDVDLAEEELRRFAVQIGTNRRSRVSYLRALAALERWRGETDHAIGHLEEAALLAEALGLPGEHWQIEAALAEMHQQDGDDESAQYALARATEIVQALADKMGNDNLRARFLSAAARYLGTGFRVAGSPSAHS